MSNRIPLPIRDGLNPSRIIVPQEYAGNTAHQVVSILIDTQRYRHPQDDEAAIDARFAQGEVVGEWGDPYAPEDILTEGDHLWFYRMPAEEEPVPYEIQRIYEDEDILVVDKPPFLATFPRASHITETLLVRMRRQTGNNDLVPAHRLDRLTSGILVMVKTPALRGAFQQLFAERKISKQYEAIAHKSDTVKPGDLWAHRLEKTHGVLRTEVVEGEPNSFTKVLDVRPVTYENAPLSLRAEADAGLVNLDDLAIYRLGPITGKTHQLRVHMMLAGVPILGDPIYPVMLPKEEEDFAHPMYLHASRLSFIDPRDSTPQEFTSWYDCVHDLNE
ncbi:MAG: pseudouridine synthase [Corynebacterium sp.]|nr:pseudouridine synthase [Corynebacterium sp.]